MDVIPLKINEHVRIEIEHLPGGYIVTAFAIVGMPQRVIATNPEEAINCIVSWLKPRLVETSIPTEPPMPA